MACCLDKKWNGAQELSIGTRPRMRTVASEMGSNICILLYLNTIFEYLYLYLYLKATCYEYLYLYLNISEVFQKHQILKNTFKYNVLDAHVGS